MEQLQIYLLGQLRLFVGERPFPFKSLPRVKTLLAYLLLHPDNPIPRNKLAFTLWPDVPETKAKSRLRRHIYELRQALPPTTEELPWMIVNAQTIQWNPAAPCWLDTAAFNYLIRQPNRLAEAIALYTGPLLPDEDESWLLLPRQQLQNGYQQTLQQLIEHNWRQDDWQQALVYAQQLLHSDPFHEKGIQQLLALLYGLGERATAVSRYQQFTDQLMADLEVPPLPETTAVYDAIHANEETTAVFALAELVAPPVAPQETATKHPTSGNIPNLLQPLIGREQELAELIQFMIGKSPVRLLTLTGISGIGKTHLAIATAIQLQNHYATCFPDGCFFLTLASLSQPEQVWTTIANQLQVKVKGQNDPFAVLREHLRYKQCLLILDNFEHLLTAVPALQTLLQAAPQLQILVTSIVPLGIIGEQEYPLHALQLPALAEKAAITTLMQNEAVAFFTAIAQTANPHFQLDEKNSTDVVKICHQLDGIPLALELAAAQSKHLTPTLLQQQLVVSQQLVSQATTTRPDRHQSISAALQWSFDLLTDAEKELLLQLSYFPDSFSLTAVSVICFQHSITEIDAFDADIFNRLTQLANKHFIYSVNRPTVEGVIRFAMLRTIRHFLREQFPPAIDLSWQLRYLNYYAQSIWPLRIEYHDNAPKWQRWLENETENVRQALNWAYTSDDESQFAPLGVKIVIGMGPYWETAMHLTEALFQFQRFDSRLNNCSPETQIRFLRAAGTIADLVGLPDDVAFDYRERALALARQGEDPELICYCLDTFGSSANRRGDFARGERMLREALALEKEMHPQQIRYRQASIMMNLSIAIKRNSADIEQALTLQEGCVDFLRTQNRPSDLAKAILSLGHTYRGIGNHQKDAACIREGLQIGQKLNDRFVQILFLTAVAEHAKFHHQFADSVQVYGALLTLSQTFHIGWPPYMQEGFTRDLETCHGQITATAYTLAWEKGTRLSLEEAVSLAHQIISDHLDVLDNQ